MKFLKLTYLIFWLISIPVLVSAQQINPSVKYKTYLVGQHFKDTLKSTFQPSCQVPLTFNTIGNPIRKIASNTWELTLVPIGGLTGHYTFPIQYTETATKVKYLTYTVNYVPSIVNAKIDYVSVAPQDTVDINALANDVSTAPGLSITNISSVQYGQAWLENGNIKYVAPYEFTSDAITYTIADDFGTEAIGVIKVIAEGIALANLDTLNLSVANIHTKEIRLLSGNFTIDSNDAPSMGVLSQVHPQVWKYKPNTNVQGIDDFTFADGQGHEVKVIMRVINVTQNKSSVRDDRFYTTVNTPLTFDVLANDLAYHYPISAFSNGLVHDTLGVFTYIPPQGFSGEKNFTYTVNYGAGNTYVGKIKIYIGNYMPKQDLDYVFHTLKNKEIVFEYNVPVTGYSFDIVDTPIFGTVEFFNDQTNLDLGCNNVSNESLILYTPDAGYYGLDSFSINYCIADTCYTYKLTVNIHDNIEDDCICQGDDCVYKGDLNGDGRVSMTDLFALSKYIGLSGPIRQDSLLPFWGGQYGPNWIYNQGNGKNVSKVDANGDGRISNDDMNEVDAHYGLFNNLVPNEVLSVKDFPFYLVPNSTELDSGDVLILDVYYGTDAKPVVNAVGVAFELNLPAAIVDSASVTGYFEENGWFADGGSSLQLIKQPVDGRIQAGFVKTDLIVDDEISGFIPISYGNTQLIVDDEISGFRPGVSGNGKVGQFQLIVDDEISGFKSSDEFFYATISLDNAEMEGANGEKYTVPSSEITVKIRRNKVINPQPQAEKLLVYPNPTSTQLNVHFNGQNSIKAYRIINTMGAIISEVTNYDDQHATINTASLQNGSYILQVTTAGNTVSKRFEVFNK
jgi:hypothetical protein